MSYKDKYISYQKSRGEGIRERRENSTKLKLTQTFKDSLIFEEIKLYKTDNIIPIQLERKGDDPTEKTVVVYPNFILKTGDIFTRNNQENWLCVDDDVHSVYVTATAQRCNFDLKWINNNQEIIIIPAFMKAGDASNNAIDTDTMMSVPSARRIIKTQNNLETKKIKKKDRFLIDNQAFEVFDIDPTSEKGLITFALESSQISNANDNLDLGIADYYIKIKKDNININSQDFLMLTLNQPYDLNIVIKNGDQIIDNLNLNYEYDSNKISIDKNKIIPKAIAMGSFKVIYKGTEKIINYTIQNNYNLNHQAIIEGKSTINLGKTQEYLCYFYTNGQLVSSDFNFSIEDSYGNPSNLASIVNQDKTKNSCTIKASSSSTYLNKNFVLKVKSDSGIFESKITITLKSLL